MLYVWLFHLTQKHTRIGRKALDITPLALGIERVEGEAALSTAAQTCYDDKFAAWYLQVYILQVVDPGTFYLYAIIHFVVYRLRFTVYRTATCHLLISPHRLLSIISCIFFLGSLWPSRNISLVMAHSGVLSYPLTTPASIKGRLVS